MDNAWGDRLVEEAAGVGIALDPPQVQALSDYADLMLKWNAKVNLTRITGHEEVRIKHLVDSIAGLPLLPTGSLQIIDMGAGAGLPGIPWLICRADVSVTLVDAVAKKVAFLKTALAHLRLAPRGKALAVHLGGNPDAERLGRAQVVVSRAFTSLPEILQLARPYLTSDGCVMAMLSHRDSESEARAVAEQNGFDVVAVRTFELPQKMGKRMVLRAVPRGT